MDADDICFYLFKNYINNPKDFHRCTQINKKWNRNCKKIKYTKMDQFKKKISKDNTPPMESSRVYFTLPNNNKHGKEQLFKPASYFAQTRIHEINWKNGKKHGKEKWVIEKYYVSTLLDSFHFGWQPLAESENIVFEINWRNGKKHGKEIIALQTGEKIEFIWEKNNIKTINFIDA